MNYDIRKQLEELQKYYYIAIDEAFNAKTVLGETIFEEMRQDQLKKKAKILDKNIEFETNLKIYELTPHRRGFLWILKNEARKLKEREVNVDDRIELDTRTANVEMLEEKIYAEAEPLFEKPSLFRRIFKRNKQITFRAKHRQPLPRLLLHSLRRLRKPQNPRPLRVVQRITPTTSTENRTPPPRQWKNRNRRQSAK